jgi:hypothetical protein
MRGARGAGDGGNSRVECRGGNHGSEEADGY